MKRMMKTVSLLLAWMLAFSGMIVCRGEAQESAKTPDRELERALKAGLFQEEWLDHLDAAVTFSEYSDMIAAAVCLWDENMLSQWTDLSYLAAESDETMKVEDAVVMLSYLWVMMGEAEEYPNVMIDNDWSLAPPEETDRAASCLSWNYPYFPDWDQRIVYPAFNSNYVWGGVMTFPLLMSPVSGEFVLPYHSGEGLSYLKTPLSRERSVRMLIRILEYCRIELNPVWADYCSLSDAGTYDQSVITDDLMNAPCDLPEVTQASLPAAWHGAGISARKAYSDKYLHFSETDVRFLADNHFNFTRLFFSFETLRYPDYPSDVRRINRNELIELDRMLAWCMKYGVHLQISMIGYLDGNGHADSDNMPCDEKAWELTRDYWTMLAKRYRGIPSKYLTFDLCNETEPENDEQSRAEAKQGLSIVVDAVRAADPDRVLLYSQASNGQKEWTEAIASLGIAVGCHPYKPAFITAGDWSYAEMNPYAEPVWPQPWFPIGEVMQGRSEVILSGAVDDAELTLHAMNSGESPCIVIYADGREINRLDPRGILQENDEYYYKDTAWHTHIPAGSTEVSITVAEDWVRLDTIMIERNGVRTVMVPSDTMDYPDFREPLPLIVKGDGTYTNSENIVYDEDLIYELAVKPYRDIADRHGVGFMCNEFGIYGTLVHWKIDTVAAYHETCLNMMEKYGLGWCYCEIYNIYPKHLRILYGEESQWTGATVEEINYMFDDGTNDRILICRELLDVFRNRLIH